VTQRAHLWERRLYRLCNESEMAFVSSMGRHRNRLKCPWFVVDHPLCRWAHVGTVSDEGDQGPRIARVARDRVPPP